MADRCRLGIGSSIANKNLARRFFGQLRVRFPHATAVPHFPNAFADVARAFRIRPQPAGYLRVLQRFFNSEEDRLGREKTFLQPDGLGEWIAARFVGGGHQAEQDSPIHRRP